LSEIAHLFDINGISRVPVVAEQRVVGIVSRADLLKTMAVAKARPGEQSSNSDAADLPVTM
jgi:Predicted transcriptional regulator containing CBS domains